MINPDLRLHTVLVAGVLAIGTLCAFLITAGNQVETIPAEPKAETTSQAAEPATIPESTAPLYDVPLDADLQRHIVELAGAEHGIDPAIIFAMAEVETDYRPDAVGDNGKSLGMFQVQACWHEDRMARLGVTDLLDPYQCAAVAVDYLAELIARGNGIEWALAAFNAGPTGANRGYGSSYAAEVLAISETIKEGVKAHDMDQQPCG